MALSYLKKSTLKNIAKSQGLQVTKAFTEQFDILVHHIYLDSIDNAKVDNRKTLMETDL